MTSHIRSLFISLLLLSGWSCTSKTTAKEEPSAWSVVDAAFGHAFFDASARAKLFNVEVADLLILPGLVDSKRYQFLQVAELRRLSADRRAGTVAIAIDGWPTALTIELSHTTDGWRISKIPAAETQRALLAPTGPEGLPQARSARSWRGGLAGRDSAGRPTAAVLVLARKERVFVDGHELPDNSDQTVVAAITEALKGRRALARNAKATYLSQVAIALPARAGALQHLQVAQWAIDAGAEVLQLIVRGADGGPAYLPLARPEPASSGSHPWVIRVRQDLTGVKLTLGETILDVVANDSGIDLAKVSKAYQRLTGTEPAPEGTLLITDLNGDHASTIALFDTCHSAAPDLPIVTQKP